MWTRVRCVNLLIALHVVVVIVGCGGANPVSPTALRDTSSASSVFSTSEPSALSPDAPLSQSYTIQFTDVGPDRAEVTTYSESGFSISAAVANWIAFGYGHPGPSLVFYTPAGVTTSGEVTIRTAEGLSLFRFTSVDLYSSITRIPYVITGALAGQAVFTESGTLGNTFGNFVQVSSSHNDVPIDTLVIQLTNGTAQNPMGLDNIVVRR